MVGRRLGEEDGVDSGREEHGILEEHLCTGVADSSDEKVVGWCLHWDD